MAIDPDGGNKGGRIHVVWLEASAPPGLGGLPPPPNPILSFHSDDGGKSFSPINQVNSIKRSLVVAPALAVGADHSINVLYYDLQEDVRDYEGLEGPVWDGKWSLVLATSGSDGKNFTDRLVDSDIVPPERVMLIFTMPPPSLAVGKDGQVFASWHDARNGDWDIFFRSSNDGGEKWRKPVRLNDDKLRNGRNQLMPKLSVAPDGRLDAIFFDRRSSVEPGQGLENRGEDVFYSYSRDDGKSFHKNLRLSAQTHDALNGPRYAVPSAAGLVEFGSRIGLWSDSQRALAAWTDTRNTYRAPHSQDIFSTEVKFPLVSNLRVRGGLALATVGVLLLVAGLAVRRVRLIREPG